MLNVSCNLPSENSNSEKQMVFHCNKLLCIYSFGTGVLFTFADDRGACSPCELWRRLSLNWGLGYSTYTGLRQSWF